MVALSLQGCMHAALAGHAAEPSSYHQLSGTQEVPTAGSQQHGSAGLSLIDNTILQLTVAISFLATCALAHLLSAAFSAARHRGEAALETEPEGGPCPRLLLDLPATAWSLVMRHLCELEPMDEEPAGFEDELHSLMVACQTTQIAALQHAPRLRYHLDRAKSHRRLHALAVHPVPQLSIRMHCEEDCSKQHIRRMFTRSSCLPWWLRDAITRVTGWQPPAASWPGVEELELQCPSEPAAPDGAPNMSTAGWGHLVGPACPNMTKLGIDCATLQPDFFRGLAQCPIQQFTAGAASSLSDAALKAAPTLIPASLPHVTSLSFDDIWEDNNILSPMVRYLAPQLTELIVCGLNCDNVQGPNGPEPWYQSLSGCSHLKRLRLEDKTLLFDDEKAAIAALPALEECVLG